MNLQFLETVNEPPCSVVGQLGETTHKNKRVSETISGSKKVPVKDATPTLAEMRIT